MAVDEQSLLGCGRSIDEVWEHIDDPPDGHEATCPDCQQARRSLARLEQATSTLRASEENDPLLQPSAAAKASIMELARAEVRRGRRLPLRAPSQDHQPAELTISEQAVAGVVRFAADAIAGLRVRRCRIRPEGPDGGWPAVSADPVRVVIDLSAAMSAGASVTAVSDQLRRRVREAVLGETGVLVSAVNIVVEDVFDA